jgi:hypothetical protein
MFSACQSRSLSLLCQRPNNYLFVESEDTTYLCLGIVAARLSRNSDARVTGLIDSIEQYVLGKVDKLHLVHSLGWQLLIKKL